MKTYKIILFMIVAFMMTVATASAAKVANLSWDALTDPPADFGGYRVYQADTTSGELVWNAIADVKAGDPTVYDVTVEGDQNYTWALTTFDVTGNESAKCDSFTLTLDTTPPPVPTGFKAVWEKLVSAVVNFLKLRWVS